MARLYLLDTNIVSQLAKSPHGVLAERVMRVGVDNVVTSVVVACEVRYGVAKKNAQTLAKQIDAVLGAMQIKPLVAGVEVEYAAIRVSLEKKGTPIGNNDLLIAAHARFLGAVCVTDNDHEFRRVHGLVVENWLTRTP